MLYALRPANGISPEFFDSVIGKQALTPIEAGAPVPAISFSLDDAQKLAAERRPELLGVRRTTVTHVVSALRTSRAIKSNRRGQLEIDRRRLEVVACECYKVMSRRIDRIVSQDALRLLHAAPARDGCPPPDFPFAKTDS